MCGIAGLLHPPATPQDELEALAHAMARPMLARGPDAGDAWADAGTGVALAHRRLAIVDLSPTGAQPMHGADGRRTLTFNGEIYNFHALRTELRELGHGFRGGSDTEVMLAAFASWGVMGALQRFVGAFALALWDDGERTLTLARDRMGEKPLYYSFHDGLLLFGSELKALRAHPRYRPGVDQDALAMLLRYGYVPAPHSIDAGTHKLLPGTFLTVHAGEAPGTPVPYWELGAAIARGQQTPFTGSEAEAADELERLLRQSLALQMVADVPVGAFLSGGVDSSAVVALMQAQSARPVRTFTIGFSDAAYDEAPHAREIARHLGTEHTEQVLTPAEVLAAIPRMPTVYDEPFADSSMIPTYLVAALARRHVTVSLSGDAGDELFAGYNRYVWGAGIWRRLGSWPRPLRQGMAGLLTSLPVAGWDGLYARGAALLPPRLRQRTPGEKLHKLAGVLPASSEADFYRSLVSRWQAPTRAVPGSQEHPRGWPPELGQLPDAVGRMMAMDLLTYLPDDILAKVDRASMGVSLEARVPLLDHRVIEFAWSLPRSYQVRDGVGKRVLREVLYRHVPRTLIERPKMGFALPLGDWLRGPLRSWAEDLLASDRLAAEGHLSPLPVRQLWEAHLSGRESHAEALWSVLMFQAWRAER